MRSTLKSGVAGALCAALAVTALPGEAWAGPTSVAGPAAVNLSSQVENVHYYRHHRHHWRHRHWARHHYYRYGYDPGAALFGAAALGLLSAPAWGWGWGHPYGYGWGYPYGYRYGWGPRYGWW